MTDIRVLRKKLADNVPVIGVFQPFESVHLTEMLGYAGFDYIVFDTEHGSFIPSDCEANIRAAEGVGIVPMVRVIHNNKENILKSLDRGSQGTLVPMVSTKEEALKAVELAKYYPIGKRGLSMSTTAGGYGKKHSVEEHIRLTNEDYVLMVQIETVEAVENIDEILQVDNIDVFFIGPSDLSQSMGKPGKSKDPEVVDTIKYLIKKITSKNKVAGIFASDTEAAKEWISEGVGFVAFGVPSIIYNGFNDCIEQMKS